MQSSGTERALSQLRVVERIDAADLLARRLLEIGFFPGALVEIVAAMWPDDDPLAVRVGGATFALRRREADQVMVS
jgi:ferrous iron transport protein A